MVLITGVISFGVWVFGLGFLIFSFSQEFSFQYIPNNQYNSSAARSSLNFIFCNSAQLTQAFLQQGIK